MKSNRKTKTITLIILGIFFAFSPLFLHNPSSTARDRDITSKYNVEIDEDNLKSSVVSGKIHIDNNWTAAKSAGICTGEGTYSSPYVIRDLEIDAGDAYPYIFINNSEVYFIIENCTLSNSGSMPGYDAEFLLFNVTNGKVINNQLNNNHGGIYLFRSMNNSITGNTVNNNVLYGIYLAGSMNNSILGNTVNNNALQGIDLNGSNNNTISENTLMNNNHDGISLLNSENNNIIGNMITNNGYMGIRSYGNSSENKIYFNCFINDFLYGHMNAYDDGSNNHWDNGIKGNYWSNYTGLDADGNGIGDVPYNITGDAGSQDNFPLMKCPISAQDGGRIPIEMIILISVISGGAVIGVATVLLIKHKRKRIE